MLNIRSKLEKELSQLQNSWMKSHFRVNIVSVCLVSLTELLVYFLFFGFEEILEIPRWNYLIYYLFIPLAVNACSILIQSLCYKSKLFPDVLKPYVLTGGLTICCFGVAVVHSMYISLAFIFVIPIVVSVIYGNKRLTTVTTGINLVLELLHIFVIKYDPDKVDPLAGVDSLVPYIVSLVAQCCLVIACYRIIDLEEDRLRITKRQDEERRMLREEARTDKLTGLYNRSALAVAFNEIVEEASQEPSNSYIIVMGDMDLFKQVNDTFGHTAGDANLALIGDIIKRHCNNGLAFRYGGDEFLMLYKNTPFNVVKKDCEDIQEEFIRRVNSDIRDIGVSMTFGIAGGTSGISPSKILADADSQLYLAKKERGSIKIKY